MPKGCAWMNWGACGGSDESLREHLSFLTVKLKLPRTKVRGSSSMKNARQQSRRRLLQHDRFMHVGFDMRGRSATGLHIAADRMQTAVEHVGCEAVPVERH